MNSRVNGGEASQCFRQFFEVSGEQDIALPADQVFGYSLTNRHSFSRRCPAPELL